MAPKRSAPPPPIESSEDTGSGSETDESEEEIAHSPPSAAPPPKQTAPPPQKILQPEVSDDESEEEDGEDEEEEEEEEEENEEEEEEAEKANHIAPSSAPPNPPRPQPEPEESESGEEEEEGTDGEAPQPVSAPKQGKKPTAPFKRSWSKDDEVRILEAVIAHRRERGTLPQPEDLAAALAGSLDNSDHGVKELAGKLKSLKSKYTRNAKKVDLPSNDLDRRIFDLSKEVWGGGGDRPAKAAVRREFGEMCQMYPFLAEELNAVERTHPGLFKREFGMIDDNKARGLDQKIKKQRMGRMKLELRALEMTKEVTKTLMSLAE